MPQPVLSISNLSVNFLSGDGIHQAVKNVSLEVNAGEIVALVGESGSGKSVTALSILRLLPSPPAQVESGQIIFSNPGKAPTDLLTLDQDSLRAIRGNNISMVFQEPMTSLNPVYTCGEQVTEVLRAHRKISKEEALKQTIYWFERVDLPDPAGICTRFPHQLSGGQKQRVMIAMAMCCRPGILICDEPTTALDVTVQKNILQLIKTLQHETGMGVIFITHDLGVVAEIADRALVMFQGSIVESGVVSELFRSPVHPYTRALLACRPAHHRRGDRLPVVSDFLSDPDNKAKLSTPKPGSESQTTDAEPLIHVENLSVLFPNKKNWLGKTLTYTKAVNRISFDVLQNETLGVVGESGCGKTTLGRALLKLIPVTEGKIYFRQADLDLYTSDELRTLRKQLQIVFQDPYSSLNPRKKIGYAIEEPLKVHRLITDAGERRKRVIELLEKVGLEAEHYHRYPHEFSGGQRQRIVIARALALRPSFIICDESVSALDVSVQAQVLNLLNDLKKEFGFTIVFISHDLSVVRYFSDRILVMNKGEIEESGPADQIYEKPVKDYTKKLIAAIPRA
jgi:peptide/nickel transport system ATP-binding protein